MKISALNKAAHILSGTFSIGHFFLKEVHTTYNIIMFQALVSMTSISTPHLQDRPKIKGLHFLVKTFITLKIPHQRFWYSTLY